MVETSSEYLSIKITEFLMKTVGFWNPETEKERRILNVILTYTLLAIGVALGVESLDFYYSWGDFYAITYTACSTMPVVIILIKVILFLSRRDEIMKIIKYTHENFWYREYDAVGKHVLDEIDKKAIMLVCSFTFFVQGTVVTYMLAPIVENIGKNETDRVLPFTLWLDLPSTTTPYFEIIFVIQTLALIHSGVCFCCFDNFLSILCIHVAGQFKILQHKLKSIFESNCLETSKEGVKYLQSEAVYEEFKNCVDQHRTFIRYVEKMESLFACTTLCQLMISSIMLCVAGFQVCLARGSLVRRMIFIAHTAGCFFQLFAITVTVNEVIVESLAVGDAAYSSNWESSPYKLHKRFRQGLLIMMIRSRRPCYITAGGFSPVSLETFMAVLSTAASYFTLLRKLDVAYEE